MDLSEQARNLNEDFDPDAVFQARNLLAIHRNICETWLAANVTYFFIVMLHLGWKN